MSPTFREEAIPQASLNRYSRFPWGEVEKEGRKTLNRLVRFIDHFRELNTVSRWERRGLATERRRPLKGNGKM